ncbi:MAG: recombinase family protein [Candidatus Paracaedibacteraceae bacterium]|nr:recombinase family protein [Candidatus Paracaedibacteraceae bacterium]
MFALVIKFRRGIEYRNLKHLINIVEDIKNKEIGFKILRGQRPQIDTTPPYGKLVFGMVAAVAEFGRDHHRRANEGRIRSGLCLREEMQPIS